MSRFVRSAQEGGRKPVVRSPMPSRLFALVACGAFCLSAEHACGETVLAPFGQVALVDEIDASGDGAAHRFLDSPVGASRVATILGEACRVLTPVSNESSHVVYRLGEGKGLKAGGHYVLAVEYPEDVSRGMVVVNSGNETIRGFHTGWAVGDALNAKYTSHHCESLDMPMAGNWQWWTLLIRLHDRFAEKGRAGSPSPRPLLPADGFDVAVAHFSAPNDPLSAGIAVRRIRLYEVLEPEGLALTVRLPPPELPRRHLFWREEMSDGVLGTGSTPVADRGVAVALDWFRHKAGMSRFLGYNTYAKDLLEFGACQHWDSTPHGGNNWVFFDSAMKDLWGQIVGVMGETGLNVLPCYEYSGSKGYSGLGPQRRAKPLTRDDAYTHIAWIESANADITDPDTREDFRKMLDLTVVRMRDRAHFVGAWLRPRSQLPVGFWDPTRARFATEANGGVTVTREQIRTDTALYGRYLDWWHGKRRGFLVAMRDYLRADGLPDAVVLFTGCPAEPGVGFGDWTPRFVTERADLWAPILPSAQLLTPEQVAAQGLYLQGLLSPGLNWGSWEVHHAQPRDDPERYANNDGVMLTHAFNRLYTVLDSGTMERYRTQSGLAMVRHYGLNENMMFDAQDQPKLGYFAADIERAGRACMQAEVVAMATGDPTMVGYLVGSNFGRGFPEAVREFNANYLALPALPSQRLDSATDDPDVVVRGIETGTHGTHLAVVNPTRHAKRAVRIQLPEGVTTVEALATGAPLATPEGVLTLDLQAYQVVSLGIGTANAPELPPVVVPEPALFREGWWLPTVAGTTYDWTGDGSWDASNGFPRAAGDVAHITNDIAGAQAIRLRRDIAVGRLELGDAAAPGFGFTLATVSGEDYRLTFASGRDGLPAHLLLSAGVAAANGLNLPMALGSDLVVDLGGTSATDRQTLSFGGIMALEGHSIVFTNGVQGQAQVTVDAGDFTGAGRVVNNSRSTVSVTGAPKAFAGRLIANGPGAGSNAATFTMTDSGFTNALEFLINGAYSNSNVRLGGGIHSGSGTPLSANPGQRLTRRTISLNGGYLRAHGQPATVGTANDWQKGLEWVRDEVDVLRFNSGYSYVGIGKGANTQGTVLDVGRLERGRGASVYLFEVNSPDRNLMVGNATEWLLGAGGDAGTTTRSIVPWIGVYASGGFTAPQGFATYDATTGFRALNTADEYATSLTAGAAHNVSANSVTLTSDATVNSLRFTGGTSNIGTDRTLTVASGGLFFTGTGTLGASGNAAAGALSFGTVEGVLSVHANNSATIGAVLAGTDGFSKIQTGTLTLTGANTVSGPVHVGGGTLRVGNGTVGSTLGGGDVEVHAGARLRVSCAAAIADTAMVRLNNRGPDQYLGLIELDAGRSETVRFLVLGNRGLVAGTYGGPQSVASHKLPDYFVGEGLLTVTDDGTRLFQETLIVVK